MFNPDTPAGAATTVTPSIAYLAAQYLLGLPIEKWVSAAGLVLILLQVFFLIRNEIRKKHAGKAGE